MPTTARARAVALLATVFLAACGGGGDGGTSPNPIPEDFSVTLSATTLSVEQGSSSSVSASIGRTGNFSGTVNLTAEGAPSGLTVSFAPAAVAAGTPSTTVTVTAAGTLAAGAYSFTVRAQAAGRTDRTASISVTVTPRPAIAIALAPASGSAAQGANTTYAATVTRTNFTGAVTVAVSGAPTGVTTATSAAGDVTTITVTVAASVAPGSYNLVTTASGTGVTAVSATFALTVTAAPAAAITLTATPNAVSAQAGGAGVPVTVGITRTNFTGTVVVAVQSGLPAGVTASNNPQGPTAANAVVVTFTASAAATPGEYTVVLQGAGFQATAGTVSITLTVTPAQATSSIALSASPGALTLQRGQNGGVTLTIARTNYAGAVNLAATGVPAGVTPTFTPINTNGTTAQLGLSVGAGAPLGTHTITVTATGTGVSAAQATVSLTVTAQSAGGNITWQFCPAVTGTPVWVAVQDGDANAPWTRVTGTLFDSYSFNISSRGAVAYVLQPASATATLHIAYGSQAELAARGASQCAGQLLTKLLRGTVTGFQGGTEFIGVAFGGAAADGAPTAALPDFMISNAPDGVRDLVATRSSINIGNPQNPVTLNRFFIKRGLNPPNQSQLPTVDFTGPDSFDPETRTATINGIVAGEQVSASGSFISSTQSFGSLGSSALSSGSTAPLNVFPASRTVDGDVHAHFVNAGTVSGGSVSQIRSVARMFRNPGNISFDLGPQVNVPTISVLWQVPYARLRAQVARQAEYDDLWTANFSQSVPGFIRSVVITMTPGYMGSAATFDVSIPDFTGVAGWQNSWGPIAGNSTAWNVALTGWVAGDFQLRDGAHYRVGQRQGTIVP